MIWFSLIIGGCAAPLQNVGNHFYDYQRLTSTLRKVSEKHSSFIEVYTIGVTYEGRGIYAIKIGKDSVTKNKPGLLAIFAEHAGEHDTTSLAMAIVQYIADNYQRDKRVVEALEKIELWIIPMVNPDGVDYDLSGVVKPFSWRKNRRPTGPVTIGVDLNRNWGFTEESTTLSESENRLAKKDSSHYAGERPFSELETQAIRDFLLAHTNIRIFVDYHSGSGGFMQGGVGCSKGRGSRTGLHPEIDDFCGELIERLAKTVSDPKDSRPSYLVASRDDAIDVIRERLPFYIRPFFTSKLMKEPGTAVEYAYDQLGMVAVGVEMFRDKGFLRNLPESQYQLTENQLRGVLLFSKVLVNSNTDVQRITRRSSRHE